MGVDYTVTIGYGFPVNRKSLSPTFAAEIEEGGIYEFMERTFYYGKDRPFPALGMATLGSYYESGDGAIVHFVTVPRLTKSFDAYDAPGGEFAINNGEPTDEEYEQLSNAYGYLFDTDEGFAPRSFAGGLWS